MAKKPSKTNPPRRAQRQGRGFLQTAAVLILSVTLAGCAFAEPVVQSERLHDNEGIYSAADQPHQTFWLDIKTPQGYPAFEDMSGTVRVDGEKPSYPALVYDDGGELAAQDDPAAVQVQIKGNAAYRAHFRSFKLSLIEDERLHAQRVFTLYKLPEDATKISMRFGLDAFSMLGDMVSVRTSFARLYLRNADQSREYADYGLYTVAEHLGSRYLRSHGLDRYGELYEAKSFHFSHNEWSRQSEAARADALEYNNGTNPEKLDNMLAELENTDDFETFFETYFDRENYLTFLAGSILLGNRRVGQSGFQLYSPTDSEKWYFLPVPEDRLISEAGDRRFAEVAEGNFGIAMLYMNELHCQFFQIERNRQALADKIEEVGEIWSDEALMQLLTGYKQTLAQFAAQNPDYALLPQSPQETEERIDRIPAQIRANARLALENLTKPSPFALERAEKEGEAWRFTWEDAAREDEKLIWKLVISDDAEGREVRFEAETNEPEMLVDETLEGRIFLRLTAVNAAGESSAAEGFALDANENRIWGVNALVASGEVMTDG